MQSSLSRFLAALVAAAAFFVSGSALAQKVRFQTSMGDIVVELDAAKSPKTVDNFLQYVKAGFYDGTIFHRVIDNFMIQGGGMTADMKE
jgi:peptidyl-prolyl cis-trans isomerase A (cyclophilin A)